MKHTALLWIAGVSVVVAAQGAHRPRYGGELRVEIREAPRTPDRGAAAFLSEVFETLVRLDERGDPQPWLATSWKHDPAGKRWVFTARPNVILHNGAVWAPPGGIVTVPDDQPIEQILRVLARPRNAIVEKAADGSLVGTGPFRLTQWEAGKSAIMTAHDGYWRGRPYLDTIRIRMGRIPQDQAADVETGRADAVEIPLTEVRRLRQRGTNVAISAPEETLALYFENGSVPERLREAVALSIDRAAIHSVLLQRQGEISGALLPQWLTGYGFLFPTEHNVARARQLASGGATLSFAYDRQDTAIRAIGERIAVNASEAGITLRLLEAGADVRLVRLPPVSRNVWSALEDAAALLGAPAPAPAASPYQMEAALLQGLRAIPLFHLPRAWALAPAVRHWAADELADVWLDAPKP